MRSLILSQKINQIIKSSVQLFPALFYVQLSWGHIDYSGFQSLKPALNDSAIIQLNASSLSNQFNPKVIKESKHCSGEISFGNIFIATGQKVGLPSIQKGQQLEFSTALVPTIREIVSYKSTGNSSANAPESNNNKHFLNGVPVHLRLLPLAVLV